MKVTWKFFIKKLLFYIFHKPYKNLEILMETLENYEWFIQKFQWIIIIDIEYQCRTTFFLLIISTSAKLNGAWMKFNGDKKMKIVFSENLLILMNSRGFRNVLNGTCCQLNLQNISFIFQRIILPHWNQN